jgi:transmembrane sensor
MIPQNELERIAILLFRDFHTGLDAEEAAELEGWQSAHPGLATRARALLSEGKLPETLIRLEIADLEIRKKLLAASVPVEPGIENHSAEAGLSSFASPKTNAGSNGKIFSIHSRWVRYAASVIILLGLGVLLRQKSLPGQPMPLKNNQSAQVNNIGPGSDKAVLTLADGSKIILDNAGNGQLATQGSIKIIKLSGGELKYEGGADDQSGKEDGGPVVYNTISTPRAGQFSLVLPDGSKVWLNAASSMTFPTRFGKDQRRVSMSGEVYFEVAQEINRPFFVDMKGFATVEVLGTHFNINAYPDEPVIKTTLLEGKVKVVKDREMQMLSPGEQAAISDHIQLRKRVDTDQVMAWKNGLFNFDEADIKTLMRELERWYDIKVSYQDPLPAIRFTGKMYRNENLSTVLQFLSEYGLQFRTEGRTVSVSEKQHSN